MESESLEPNTNPPPKRESDTKRWRLSILDDPNVIQTIDEDPVFRFLSKYWTQIALTIGAIIIVFYVKGKFEGTYERALGDSSALYTNVTKEFEEYNKLFGELSALKVQSSETNDSKDEEKEKKLKAADEKLQESRRRLGEYLNALRFKREPYNQIAGIYFGVLEVLSGNLAGARKELQDSHWNSLDAKSEARFYAELKALVLARAILDDPASYQEGRGLLKSLVENGAYVSASAAMTFSRISITDEEKKEAKEVLGVFVSKRSEQREVLKEELKRLGV